MPRNGLQIKKMEIKIFEKNNNMPTENRKGIGPEEVEVDIEVWFDERKSH